MKLWVEVVLEANAEALYQVFGVISIHARIVDEMRMARLPERTMGRMSLALEGEIDPRDLITALLKAPAVRAASVVRELHRMTGPL